MFKRNKIAEISKNVKLYKMSLVDFKKNYKFTNWNKNRPVDSVRVDNINNHYYSNCTNFVPGIIHAWNNNDVLEIFDGIHRLTSALNVSKDLQILLQIYNTSEEFVINEFKNINKSVSIPYVYLEDDNLVKIKCLESISSKFCEKYKEFVSPSRNHQQQNFNRDKLVDFLSSFNIDFTKDNIDELVLNELHGLNYEAKVFIENHSIKTPKKCDYHKFWLFYLSNSFIRMKVENALRLK